MLRSSTGVFTSELVAELPINTALCGAGKGKKRLKDSNHDSRYYSAALSLAVPTSDSRLLFLLSIGKGL